jgi:hypothetical protein
MLFHIARSGSESGRCPATIAALIAGIPSFLIWLMPSLICPTAAFIGVP